jgi:hypothetical protein
LSKSKAPIAFSHRRFYVLVSSLMILVILVPIVVYWSDQRITEHPRWDDELHYAQLFNVNVDIAADSINGTFYPME